MEVDLRITIDDLNICLVGLGKLPLEASIGTWSRLKAAGEQAVAKASRPVVAEEPPAEPAKKE